MNPRDARRIERHDLGFFMDPGVRGRGVKCLNFFHREVEAKKESRKCENLRLSFCHGYVPCDQIEGPTSPAGTG